MQELLNLFFHLNVSAAAASKKIIFFYLLKYFVMLKRETFVPIMEGMVVTYLSQAVLPED